MQILPDRFHVASDFALILPDVLLIDSGTLLALIFSASGLAF